MYILRYLLCIYKYTCFMFCSAYMTYYTYYLVACFLLNRSECINPLHPYWQLRCLPHLLSTINYSSSPLLSTVRLFLVFSLKNNASVNIPVHLSLGTNVNISLGSYPKSGTTVSKAMYICYCDRNCPSVP